MKILGLRTAVVFFATWVFSQVVGRAEPQVVFDNTSNLINKTPDILTSREYGDELALAGTARYVTGFEFAYYGDFTNAAAVTYNIRFYANDGTDAFPGAPTALRPHTILWDSGAQTATRGVNRVVFSVPSILVPDRFTWTATFHGVTATPGNAAALMLANPATVGAFLPGSGTLPGVIGSYDDYWKYDFPGPLNEGQGWALYAFGFGPNDPKANFYAQVVADTAPLEGLELLTDPLSFDATANDAIRWNQFADGAILKNPNAAVSVGGVQVQIRQTTKSPAVAVADNNFAFPVGEYLLNNRAGGTLTLDFDQGVYGIGVNLEDVLETAGSYRVSGFRVTATSTNELDSFVVNRSAGHRLTFVGFRSPNPRINRLTISDNSGHFFLGQVRLRVAPSPTLRIVAQHPMFDLQWPLPALDFQLQYATNLTPPIVWQRWTNSPLEINGVNHQFLSEATGRGVFFRLNAVSPR